MPFLSMVRRPAWLTRRRTQRFSLSSQKRRDCRLGRKRRSVLLLAWETWFPLSGFLPVTWHTRGMAKNSAPKKKSGFIPQPANSLKEGVSFERKSRPSRSRGASRSYETQIYSHFEL